MAYLKAETATTLQIDAILRVDQVERNYVFVQRIPHIFFEAGEYAEGWFPIKVDDRQDTNYDHSGAQNNQDCHVPFDIHLVSLLIGETATVRIRL